MGVYLSTPITEKVSDDKKCDSFTYGASSMQGWRMTQEVAQCKRQMSRQTTLFPSLHPLVIQTQSQSPMAYCF